MLKIRTTPDVIGQIELDDVVHDVVAIKVGDQTRLGRLLAVAKAAKDAGENGSDPTQHAKESILVSVPTLTLEQLDALDARAFAALSEYVAKCQERDVLETEESLRADPTSPKRSKRRGFGGGRSKK